MKPSDRQLVILQVASALEGGGGEQISLRLHRAFRRLGHRSILFAGRVSATTDEDVFALPGRWEASRRARAVYAVCRRILALTGGRGRRRLLPLFETVMFPRFTWDLWRGHEDFTQPGSRLLLSLCPERPDAALLHNLHARWNRREGFFDLTYLEPLGRELPVVLAPQDPWLLTGHCAHPIDCPRWRTGCGACPDLAIYPAVRRDATAVNFRRKRTIFARSRLHVAAPSQWLTAMFAESGIALAGLRRIYNGVDTGRFRPGPSAAARELLGLPADRKIVLVSGNALRTNPWKGFSWLIDAARRLADEGQPTPVDFLCAGDAGETEEFGPVRVVFAGRLKDASRMAEYYRAADVYFQPSRADTAPFSVLEAMSTGRPVVATAVGGIPEQVQDGRSGFLARPGDSQAMADRIGALLADPALARDMGERGRLRVLEYFDFSRQTDDLLAWMQELAAPG
jgi:glycosyltransferase involved in cell wall biosynthesis